MLDSLRISHADEHPILSRLDENTTLTAHLQIEVNQVNFQLTSEDDKILISAEKFTDLRHLSDHALRPFFRNMSTLIEIDSVLERMGLTVYVQNRFFSIIGLKANPLLRKILYWFIARKS